MRRDNCTVCSSDYLCSRCSDTGEGKVLSENGIAYEVEQQAAKYAVKHTARWEVCNTEELPESTDKIYVARAVDPKQSQAVKKMCFDNVAISLLCNAVPGADSGAEKYGCWNWNQLEDGSMSLNTYLNALQRHLLLYRSGQDYASDTGVHNLKSMLTGLGVVLDAILFGKIKDDRVKLSAAQIETLEKLINKEI